MFKLKKTEILISIAFIFFLTVAFNKLDHNNEVNSAACNVKLDSKEFLGKINSDLTRKQLKEPYGESVLGNWTADVIKKYAKADIGIINNSVLSCDLNKGNIYLENILTFMPFDNKIETVIVNKKQLRLILEQAIGDYEGSNNKTMLGRAIQVSGIEFSYDPSKEYGNRVMTILKEGGSPISDSEVFKLAGPDFLLDGGNGFLEFKTSEVKATLANTNKLVRDALIDDIRSNKTIKYSINDRIVPVSQ